MENGVKARDYRGTTLKGRGWLCPRLAQGAGGIPLHPSTEVGAAPGEEGVPGPAECVPPGFIWVLLV